MPWATPARLGALRLSGSLTFEMLAGALHVTFAGGRAEIGALVVEAAAGALIWQGSGYTGTIAGTAVSAVGDARVGGSLTLAVGGGGLASGSGDLTIHVAGYEISGAASVGVAPDGATTVALADGHVDVGAFQLSFPRALFAIGPMGLTGATLGASVNVSGGGLTLAANATFTVKAALERPGGHDVAIVLRPLYIGAGEVVFHVGAGPPSRLELSPDRRGTAIHLGPASLEGAGFRADVASAVIHIEPAAGGIAVTLTASSLTVQGSPAAVTFPSARLELSGTESADWSLHLGDDGHAVSVSALAGALIVAVDGTTTLRPAAAVRRLAITGGAGADSLTVDASAVAVAIAFDGAGGADTVHGPALDLTWTIDVRGGGTAAGLAFTGVEHLVGAAGNEDTFVFGPAGALAGTVEGGDGGYDVVEVATEGGALTSTITGPQSGVVTRAWGRHHVRRAWSPSPSPARRT